ncbi:VOC family protein [Pendulispora albinea]|uniref:VOC family protein n=1 Tax=Pendulispora albinea TaxID=2741071 RepID=A0ABZ2MA09_9BACT
MLRMDHIGIEARDARRSAQTLAEILGAAEPAADGADGDMYRIDLDDGCFLLFAAPASPNVTTQHMAFRVDEARFGHIVDRLRAHRIAFGNDPEAPRNGNTNDPLGGAGRVYFTDENGHLFEVTC